MQRTSAPADETSTCRRDMDISTGGSAGECTNRQGDGNNGHRTEPEEGEERHRSKRRRIKVGARRVGASDMPGAPCESSKTRVRYLGSLLTLNISFAKGRGTRTAAVWNAWHVFRRLLESAGGLQFQVQRILGNCTGCSPLWLVRFCRTEWMLHKWNHARKDWHVDFLQ